MKRTIIFIGCAVVAVLMYSVPILLACSYFFKWDDFIRYVLIIAATVELIILTFTLAWKVEDECNG